MPDSGQIKGKSGGSISDVAQMAVWALESQRLNFTIIIYLLSSSFIPFFT